MHNLGNERQEHYLLHVLRRRLEYPELKRAVREQANRFKATTILIEDKSFGRTVDSGIALRGPSRRHSIRAEAGESHAAAFSHEHNRKRLCAPPEKAEWLAEYVHEMTSFPKGKFDDQCDSTSQALDWIKSGSKYDGFFNGWNRKADKAKKGTFGANHVLPRVQHARANRYQTLVHNCVGLDLW